MDRIDSEQSLWSPPSFHLLRALIWISISNQTTISNALSLNCICEDNNSIRFN